MPYVKRRYNRKKRYTPKRAPVSRYASSKTRTARPIPRRKANAATVRVDRPLVQRGPLPFARSFNVKLPYSQTFNPATAFTDTAVVQTFRLNSLFDPWQTGAGHQPMQYDQLTGIYPRNDRD